MADVVGHLAPGKDLLFPDPGDVVPKGFQEPVRPCEVRWREDGWSEPHDVAMLGANTFE